MLILLLERIDHVITIKDNLLNDSSLEIITRSLNDGRQLLLELSAFLSRSPKGKIHKRNFVFYF
jgi:hypothetical protein